MAKGITPRHEYAMVRTAPKDTQFTDLYLPFGGQLLEDRGKLPRKPWDTYLDVNTKYRDAGYYARFCCVGDMTVS